LHVVYGKSHSLAGTLVTKGLDREGEATKRPGHATTAAPGTPAATAATEATIRVPPGVAAPQADFAALAAPITEDASPPAAGVKTAAETGRDRAAAPEDTSASPRDPATPRSTSQGRLASPPQAATLPTEKLEPAATPERGSAETQTAGVHQWPHTTHHTVHPLTQRRHVK
jgi:hypothetical protein